MALQVRVAPSKVVWQNLLICVILFYTVYYVVLGMCCLMLRVYELDVLAPFDFKTNPSWLNTNYKVLLVSTEVTYFVCGLLFVLVVEEWVWDYGISVTILHVAITSTVMLEFPLTSHWWAALAPGSSPAHRPVSNSLGMCQAKQPAGRGHSLPISRPAALLFPEPPAIPGHGPTHHRAEDSVPPTCGLALAPGSCCRYLGSSPSHNQAEASSWNSRAYSQRPQDSDNPL
ncbi:putative transmembrane protein 244 [Bubalus kerabau]|uniref:putative transmembrane protein 244 n=1 Tax=Bubalus carabanensis TaxID=3119969 RepID=UPI00244EF002|nr:transmembrane protein 244 [Bubalus carabanensis]